MAGSTARAFPQMQQQRVHRRGPSRAAPRPRAEQAGQAAAAVAGAASSAGAPDAGATGRCGLTEAAGAPTATALEVGCDQAAGRRETAVGGAVAPAARATEQGQESAAAMPPNPAAAPARTSVASTRAKAACVAIVDRACRP